MTKIAVSVHIFYPTLWKKIQEYLSNIGVAYDLFVTCTYENEEAVRHLFTSDEIQANIIPLPNEGMDIIPFLIACKTHGLHDYDIVLKLHTKNDKTIERAEQGRTMLEGVLGTHKLTYTIIDSFNNKPTLGMVGPAAMCRSSDSLMYGNRKTFNEILHRMGVKEPSENWTFFAGTTFWIRGSALRPLINALDDLLNWEGVQLQASTGGDGSLAHALERVLGILPRLSGMTTSLTERLDASRSSFSLIPIDKYLPAKHHFYLRAGSTVFLRRLAQAEDWVKTVRRSNLFDEVYYIEAAKRYFVEGMDAAYHYVIFGDVLLINPSDKFSTSHYCTRYKDVWRAGVPALVHYIQSGEKEGRISNPSRQDWIDLAKREKIFDTSFNEKKFLDVDRSTFTAEQNSIYFDHNFSKREASRNLGAYSINASNNNLDDDCIVEFMEKYFPVEAQYYDVMARACQTRDFDLPPRIAEELTGMFGLTHAVIEAVASCKTMLKDWPAAANWWRIYWDDFVDKNFVERHRRSLIVLNQPTSNNRKSFPVAQVVPHRAGTDDRGRICIYTTLFGNIDDLPPVLCPVPGVEFVCFTDRKRNAPGWTQRIVHPSFEDITLSAKLYKILPHKFLSEYSCSLFIDANTVFFGRISHLINICERSNPFVMWQHPFRRDLYLECCAIIGHLGHSPEPVVQQMEAYHAEGLPHDTGICESSFIWRSHRDRSVNAFMEDWWEHILCYSKQDHLSLGYLMWRRDLKPIILPDSLGTSRTNVYFEKLPHKTDAIGRRIVGENHLAKDFMPHRLRNSAIAFIHHPSQAQTGSTVVRGEQLASIMSTAYHLERSVYYTSQTNLKNMIIVLTKGFLKFCSCEEIRSMRKLGNVIVADFVDEPPRPEVVSEVDALMASSLASFRQYRMTWPNIPCYHVTHHIDIRLPDVRPPNMACVRIGYFGEPLNTIKSVELAKQVTFVEDSSNQQCSAWMTRLQEFNCHYAIRRPSEICGFKPFLKGFIAAHCQSNVLIQAGEGDAVAYLGPDYPFLVKNSKPSEEFLLQEINRIQDSFGSAEWNYGLQIMAEIQTRSSRSWVIREFKEMVSDLVDMN